MRLRYILVILLFSQTCFATIEHYDNNVKQILIETAYRSWANVRVNERIDHQDEWCKLPKYKESTYEAISKALVDAMLRRNEFSIDVDSENARGIIQFDNKKILSYTQANCNALLLYNYLSHIINGRFYSEVSQKYPEKTLEATRSNIEGVKYVAQELKNYYKKFYAASRLKKFFDKFDKAVNDLGHYFDALDMYVFLSYMRSGNSNTIAGVKNMPRISIPNLRLKNTYDNTGNRLLLSTGVVPYVYNKQELLTLRKFSVYIEDKKIKKYHIRTYEKNKVLEREYDVMLNEYYEITEFLD